MSFATTVSSGSHGQRQRLSMRRGHAGVLAGVGTGVLLCVLAAVPVCTAADPTGRELGEPRRERELAETARHGQSAAQLERVVVPAS